MEILKSAAILVIGFVLLIKGADFFVEGSSSVAKKFNVPSLIIGMTIVAMGKQITVTIITWKHWKLRILTISP